MPLVVGLYQSVGSASDAKDSTEKLFSQPLPGAVPEEGTRRDTYTSSPGSSGTVGENDIYTKGPLGENIFHICLLQNSKVTRKMAKYLVGGYVTQRPGCSDFVGQVLISVVSQ